MKGRQLLLGMAAGAGAGYAIARAVQAWVTLRGPASRVVADSQAYGRRRRALTAVGAARGLAVTLGMAYGPVVPRLARGFARLPTWIRPPAFFASLTLFGGLLDLPSEFVDDYSLERRYGLTDQTPDAWFLDTFKGNAIVAALSGVLGSLAALVLRKFPRLWPLVASIGLLPLLVLANVVVPLYILPIFNKFEPLQGPLETRLRALASRFDVGDADILRMNMSRQTKKANAFVTGVGGTHRIVLGDTLIDNFEDAEIEFVVAHELGHYVAKDTWRTIALAEFVAIVLFVAASRMVDPNEGDAVLATLRVYAVLATGLQLLRPAMNTYSRSREWAADRFALAATSDPHAGAAAFRRLRDQNLAEDDVPLWYEIFFGSHPSLGKRIDALERS